MNTAIPDIEARMEAARKAETERMTAERARLHAALLDAGLTRIEAGYDGYADNGNVVDISGGMEDELEEAVAAFVWDFAYSRHPGFENGEGGQGTLVWDIATDSITLDHGDNYIEVERTLEEDL